MPYKCLAVAKSGSYIYIFLYMGEKAVSIPKPTCKVPLSVDRCGIKLGRV